MIDRPVTKEKVLAWPTRLISKGDKKQPKIKPTKCDEPIIPISVREKPMARPDSASSGPKGPVLTCTKKTAISRADMEIKTRNFASHDIINGVCGCCVSKENETAL